MSIGFLIENIAFLPIASLWRKDYAHTRVSIEKRDFFHCFSVKYFKSSDRNLDWRESSIYFDSPAQGRHRLVASSRCRGREFETFIARRLWKYWKISTTKVDLRIYFLRVFSMLTLGSIFFRLSNTETPCLIHRVKADWISLHNGICSRYVSNFLSEFGESSLPRSWFQEEI